MTYGQAARQLDRFMRRVYQMTPEYGVFQTGYGSSLLEAIDRMASDFEDIKRAFKAGAGEDPREWEPRE